jgi:hypothetical protein
MMKPSLTISLLLILAPFSLIHAQGRRPPAARPAKPAAQRNAEIGNTAVVMDETLSVLRTKPSLFAESVQRMRRGRKIQILGVAEADGVKFYKVAAPPTSTGWVQADAVFGKFRPGDAERLARLVQASSGFDQIEVAAGFLELFPDSPLRPSILLLYGDLLEEIALKLSKDAAGRLDRREMAASAAPMHSYYLNFVMLDRYRKLGIVFLFDPQARAFHYDGASWRELKAKFPASGESAEAQKRLDSLKLKMEKKTS